VAKLPSPTGEELIAALEKIGFCIIRQKGSHVRMKTIEWYSFPFMLVNQLEKDYF
jgi:predicted RNA binding protein YcfA (HicA-like mRNA interferase family)